MLEWIKALPEKFLSSVIWRSVLSQFTVFDWIVICIVLVGFFIAIKKGLGLTLLRTLQLLIAAYVGFAYRKDLFDLFRPYMEFLNAQFVAFLSFALLVLAALSISGFIFKLIKDKIKASSEPLLKMILSGGAGIFNSLLFLSIIFQAVSLGPWDALKEPLTKSTYTGSRIASVAPDVYGVLDDFVKTVTGQIEKVQSKVTSK
ncbi:MAG: CvpA family protein [Candidatus Omnitrophica bacterium]|nr:CvpA family protein [Candidatus Omnitrophota bacterium]